MHEPHHVAQKLISVMCLDGFSTEVLQVLGRRHFQLYRLRCDFSQRRLAGRGFFFPLRRAPEDAGVFYGHFAICQQSVDGVARVLRVHHFFAIAVVHAAFVAQLAVFVEDEDVRRGLRAVGAGDRLRFTVVEVRVVEMFVFEANFHFVETVADVGGIQLIDSKRLGIVWLDGHDRDAARPGSRPQVVECVARTFARSGSDCR